MRTECDRLRDRVEELEREQREAEERRERDADQRRREREGAREQSMHEARTWPDAFPKQRVLLGREWRECEKTLADAQADQRFADPEDKARDIAFWTEQMASLKGQLAAIDAAERIYAEESRLAEEAIESIRSGMRAAVAVRLREQETSARSFVEDLADRISSDDDPSNWLNW